MADAYERQKETHGSFATVIWLASGMYLFWITPGAAFLSWQSALFFIAGMFVAAVLFGWIGYGAPRGIAKALVGKPMSSSTIKFIGLILMGAEAAVIFFAAKWIVQGLIV